MNRSRRVNTRRTRGEPKTTIPAYAVWCGVAFALVGMSVSALTREGDIEKVSGSQPPTTSVVAALANRGATIDAVVDRASTGR